MRILTGEWHRRARQDSHVFMTRLVCCMLACKVCYDYYTIIPGFRFFSYYYRRGRGPHIAHIHYPSCIYLFLVGSCTLNNCKWACINDYSGTETQCTCMEGYGWQIVENPITCYFREYNADYLYVATSSCIMTIVTACKSVPAQSKKKSQESVMLLFYTKYYRSSYSTIFKMEGEWKKQQNVGTIFCHQIY